METEKLVKQIKEIIEINRILWLDFFDDESLSREEMIGVNKYYEAMKKKLDEKLSDCNGH